MSTIRVQYQINLADYRKASYYGLFLRERKPLLIFFCVMAFALLYAVGARFGLGEANPLVFLIAGAYLVWALLLFAETEKKIRVYMRKEDSLIGVDLCMTLDDRTMQMEIPNRKIHFTRAWNKLSAVFELNDLFLFYLSAQDVCLLPKRVLQVNEQEVLRQTLKIKLEERFSSRFIPKKR